MGFDSFAYSQNHKRFREHNIATNSRKRNISRILANATNYGKGKGKGKGKVVPVLNQLSTTP
jgi:hypothetical protein